MLKPDLTDKDRQKAANYLTSDVLGYISQHGAVSFADASAKSFAKLLFMLITGRINSRVTKDLLPDVVFNRQRDPQALLDERGLGQQPSAADLLPILDAVIKDNATVVAAYQAGKTSSLEFLVGQGMKATRGAADPVTLKELLIRKITSIS